MDTMLEMYKTECEKFGFQESHTSSASRFFHGLYLKVNEHLGQGWSDILRIRDGLYVELADYHMKQSITDSFTSPVPLAKFSMLLSGRLAFNIPGQGTIQVIPGDIWYTHGASAEVECTQFPGKNMRGISMSMPQNMMESWLGTCCCDVSKNLEQLILGKSNRTYALPLVKGLQPSSKCLQLATACLSAKRQTLSDTLHFEALTLDLLSHLLNANSLRDSRLQQSRKVKAAVDEAVDILQQEWDDAPTISSLARRVGLNECYLKKGFRERMGMSIGAYIRELRMIKARELIETGRYSVLQAALYVGYSNPGHFSAVFKKFYGHLPSYYRG